MQCCIVMRRFMQYESQWHNDKGRAKTSLTKYVSLTLLYRLYVRGSWRQNRTAIYWPPHLWPSALCLSCSLGLLAQRPTLLAFSTTSYQQLLWTPTQLGAPRAPSAWCGFPYQISSITPSDLCLTSVLTELYNSSKPTQSLEWHVWSSSSGNNCHTVHRSLSSSASLWSVTFTLFHIISRAHLRDFSS